MALALADRNQDWDDRGHIAAHDVDHVRLYLCVLLRQRSAARAGGRLPEARRRRMAKQINDITMALLRHFMSFDKATRPRQEFDRPKMLQPWLELDESVFVKMTRFYKKEFLRVVDSLTLLPDTIRDPGTGCTATKRLAVFILLRRWAGAEHWYVTERDMRLRKSWLIAIYGTVLRTVSPRPIFHLSLPANCAAVSSCLF